MKILATVFYQKLPGSFKKGVFLILLLFSINKIYAQIPHSFVENSVLNQGNWYKIAIEKDGIYRISYDKLQELGFQSPQEVRVFGYGGGMQPEMNYVTRIDDLEEKNIWHSENSIYFYAEAQVGTSFNSGRQIFEHQQHLYSNVAYCFLSNYNSNYTNEISFIESSTNQATHLVTTFNDFAYLEKDSLNFLNSGSQWYWHEYQNSEEKIYKFNFQNLILGANIYLKSSLLAQSSELSSFSITSGEFSQTVDIEGISATDHPPVARQKESYFEFENQNENEINIQLIYNAEDNESVGWLNYLLVNAERELKMEGNMLKFRNIQSVGIGNTSTFQLSNVTNEIQVWEITDPQKVKRINYNLTGNNLTFNLDTDSLREFIAFYPQEFFTPLFDTLFCGVVENQNIHSYQSINYVIVSHSDFIEEAQRLAEFHRTTSNLNVAVVTCQQVYNEFSSGTPDAAAIRDFVRMLYERSTETDSLKYLLLFGDGSFDNRTMASNNTNFIPTYQSYNSLSPTSSYTSDDFYGLLDFDEGATIGLLDIGVGRIPVKTINEAKTVVDKIINYNSTETEGMWRNSICFLADDGDNNAHINDAEELSAYVNENHAEFNFDKIYIDAYPQITTTQGQIVPQAHTDLYNRIHKGALIINYSGHGGYLGLTDEYLLRISDIYTWKNYGKLPVFVTATCEFSRFDNYSTSAGENVLLHTGAAIALLSTTRLVFSSPNFVLNKNFYRFAFARNNQNENYTLGDLMRYTKNATGASINKLCFALLGDPALKIASPQNIVITDSINRRFVNEAINFPINANSQMNIVGHIANKNGDKIVYYQGIIYFTLFDKKEIIPILEDAGGPALNFSFYNREVFTASAQIVDGIFNIKFFVPSNISVNIDTAKISYYAVSQNFDDANGYCDNFKLGGISNNPTVDNLGPAIQLSIEDEITGQKIREANFGGNYIIKVNLFDESGINATGCGIGRDITLTIDNLSGSIANLNNYYTPLAGSTTEGEIMYSLPNLSVGEHIIQIKAFDVFNNSSTAEISINVINSNSFEILSLYNYPNPVINSSDFYFTHNKPGASFEVELEVSGIDGVIYNILQTTITSETTIAGPIEWLANDNNGENILPGIYRYKLKVRYENTIFEKEERLLIVN